MDTLKKAGAMLQHIELFTHMRDMRGLLQLAAHMEERGDRVTLISPEQITLVGAEMSAQPSVTTAKGARIEAATAYSVLHGLKGHDAPEYAVTREELAALNARAVTELESSDALRAFEQTLARISASTSGASTSSASTGNAETPAERPSRPRRTDTPTETATAPGEQPAA